ncbi:MAG: type II secretion system protein J [Planctomycetota bacterium]
MKSRKGLTLLEIMVSLAIASMLFMAMASLFDLAVNSQVLMDEVVTERNASTKIIGIIRRDLQGMMVLKDSNAMEVRQDARNNQVLSFVTSARRRSDGKGRVAPYSESGYALRPSEANSEVYALYRRHDHFIDDKPFREGVWELVCGGIRKLEFKFSDGQTNDSLGWSKSTLPQTVKIRMEVVKRDWLDRLNELPAVRDSWEVDIYDEIVTIVYR